MAFVVALMVSAAAQAYSSGYSSSGDGSGFHIGVSVLRVDETTNYIGVPSTDSQITHIGSKGDYVLTNGFMFGLNYDSASKYYNATGTPTPETRISYGPSIGYYNSGWLIDGTYFVSSQDNFANGSYLSNGSGYQLELGYHYAVTGNFFIGVSLVYDSITYTQYTVGGVSVGQSNSQTDYYPAFDIGVNF